LFYLLGSRFSAWVHPADVHRKPKSFCAFLREKSMRTKFNLWTVFTLSIYGDS
jgi:hypothetical protein